EADCCEQTGRPSWAGRAAQGRGGVGADPDQPRRWTQARLRADPGHQGTRRRRARARHSLRCAGSARAAWPDRAAARREPTPSLPHHRSRGDGPSRPPRRARASQRGRAAAVAARRHLMDDSRATRLVETALRCYPARWRRRHGDEAAELAVLLIKDGTPAGSIACSYLAGAAREWLTPRPGRPLSAMACALLAAACALGVSAGLLAPAAPAKAARPTSTSHARRPAHCRPGSPGPTPVVISIKAHTQVIIREPGHGRSC